MRCSHAPGPRWPAVPESVAALLAGSVDLAVGPRPAGGVEGFQVDEIGIVALVARDYPLAGAKRISVGDLRTDQLVLFEARGSISARALRNACNAAGFEPATRFESGSAAVVATLAEHRVGLEC